MRVETIVSLSNPERDIIGSAITDADVVFYFISPDYNDKAGFLAALKEAYPVAHLVGCTTGGEIAESEALEKTAVSAAIKLTHSTIKIAQTHVDDISLSYAAGKKLAQQLDAPSLRLIFVLSDGLCVNGSDLVRGITENVPDKVVLTGGLAGDGPNFKKTGVGVDVLPESGVIAAVGFYGDKLKVSYGSVGGWIKFGPQRLITRSKGSVLYELDGKPALDLYKKYLGDEANKLPGSGLLFPLNIHPEGDSAHDMVRTIVGINEKENSLIFAGDVPEGYTAQLMRGSIDNLVDGAERAASLALSEFGSEHKQPIEDSLGILVSCIGRNLLMGQQASNEVEAVKRIFHGIPVVGFYSYGEICHHPQTRKCGLHNQTMTITLFSEAA